MPLVYDMPMFIQRSLLETTKPEATKRYSSKKFAYSMQRLTVKAYIIIAITALGLTSCDGIDYSSSDIDHVPPIDYSNTCFNNCGHNGTSMMAEKYFAYNHEYYNREASNGCTQAMIDANSLYC